MRDGFISRASELKKFTAREINSISCPKYKSNAEIKLMLHGKYDTLLQTRQWFVALNLALIIEFATVNRAVCFDLFLK